MKADWTSSDALSQFKLWCKEVERIIGRPLAAKQESVKVNHIYIWAGAHAGQLIQAAFNEDPALGLDTSDELLDQLAACLTHEASFREAFYSIRQKPGKNTTTFFSRIIKRADFPEGTNFLIVDKLIHGCSDTHCRHRAKGKDDTVKDRLELLRRHEAVDITMKRLGQHEPSPQLNATYSRDPTRKSQQNGVKHKPARPTDNRTSKPKTCTWCGKEPHSRDSCPAKVCRHCCNNGHFEIACIKRKKAQNSVTKRQNALTAELPDEEGYDLGAVNMCAIDSNRPQPQEVLASVKFHPQYINSSIVNFPTINGKVDTGAMVSCMPISTLSAIDLEERHCHSQVFYVTVLRHKIRL